LIFHETAAAQLTDQWRVERKVRAAIQGHSNSKKNSINSLTVHVARTNVPLSQENIYVMHTILVVVSNCCQRK
jgi:hypothetical protein